MSRKTVPFNQNGIGKLPENRPVVYKITTPSARNNYTGVAKRGRVQERLREHLPTGKDPVPGHKVQVHQMESIEAAKARETRIIARSKPPHNIQGK